MTWKPPGIKKNIQPHVVALLERAAAAGFSLTVTGGKVVRNIAGTNRPSLHSYGQAVDISVVNGAAVGPKNASSIALTKWFRNNGASEAFGPGLEPSRGGNAHANHVHLGMKADGSRSTGGGDASVSTDTSTDAPLPPNASDAEIEAYFEEHYPSLAPFMEIGELKRLFLQYARESRDEGWLTAQLRGTKWWKSQSATARARFVEERIDPGEAADKIKTLEGSIRAKAEEFLIPMSAAGVKGWAQRLARDTHTEEDFEMYLRKQAAGLWNADIGEQILAGADPRTVLSPYQALAEQVLEKSVDFSDINLKVLQTQHMNLGDYRTYLRSRPEWKQTANYREEDANTALFLEQQMGLRA